MIPSRRPPFHASPPAQPSQPPEAGAAVANDEEAVALAVSDQRTIYIVNIFIGNTARFLNSFASICQDKLADVHRRILKLDANLTLLEAQLKSSGRVKCEDTSEANLQSRPHCNATC